jgi:spore maturation protein SpmA/spore maturation protein SpmB
MLNYVWASFFIIAFITALVKFIFFGEIAIFQTIISSTYKSSELAFNISIGLTGVMAMWLGIMKIGEQGGAIKIIARLLSPILHRIFPEIPKNHSAFGSIVMNFSANMLGLDNAATPLGLKAMGELQELNTKKDTASNSQIMFLVLNTSSLMLIPVSIIAIRLSTMTKQGINGNPSDVFLPILITTFTSSLAGLLIVSFYQKINLLKKEILLFLLGISAFIAGLIFYFNGLSNSDLGIQSSFVSNILIFSVIMWFIFLGMKNKVDLFPVFIEGAKDGFNVAVKIIPYLVAMLVGVGVLRASGAMDLIFELLTIGLNYLGINADFVPALPTAFMKPFSGGAARGLMVESMLTYGADSFVGFLTSIMQGSTETTFYVIAVYFGSVNIRYTRYAIKCGLFADAVGMITAICVGYMFFG